MDWVVPVRPGDDNDELRYAIRTWQANGGLDPERDQLWVVGHCPTWLRASHYIPGNYLSSGASNVYENVLRACIAPGIPERVVIANDDFFLMEPVDVQAHAYRGTLAAHIGSLRARHSWWHRSLRVTHDYLQGRGVANPRSYELHRPLVVEAGAMAKVLWDANAVNPGNPPQWRTLYGNLHGIGGTRQPDGKIYSGITTEPNTPCWSTHDTSWRTSALAARVRDTFPAPSAWE